MHPTNCFGTANRDDETLPPRTPSQRSYAFSIRRKSPTKPPSLEWRPRDTYIDVKALEHGSEAKSYVTKSITTGRVYVVKRFEKYNILNSDCAPQPGEQPLPNEAYVLLKALTPHPNILQAFGCDMLGKRTANLYTAYCSGGDLTNQMLQFLKLGVTPPERFILHTFIELSHALCFIHNGLRYDSTTKSYSKDPAFNTTIVHADFKLENVFMSWSPDAVRRGLPDIVLGDWGFAQREDACKGIAGTPGYQAPEVAAVYKLKEDDPGAFLDAMKITGFMTPAADVWSLGQTIHKLCTGREHVVGADPMMFPARDTSRGMIGVKLGGRRGYETRALQETVQWCLKKNPLMRPKSDEGGLLLGVAIFQHALEKLEDRSPKIPNGVWASPPPETVAQEA